jgi:hypothetical protein
MSNRWLPKKRLRLTSTQQIKSLLAQSQALQKKRQQLQAQHSTKRCESGLMVDKRRTNKHLMRRSLTQQKSWG